MTRTTLLGQFRARSVKLFLRPSGLSKMLLNLLSKPIRIHPNWTLQGWRGFTRWLHGLSFPHLTFPYFISIFAIFPCYFLYFYSPFSKYFQILPNKNRTKEKRKEETTPVTPLLFLAFLFPISYYFQ